MAASYSKRLSAMDALFVYIESDLAPMHIGAVNIYRGVLPFKRYLAYMGAKISTLPRYRQRVSMAPLNLGHPTWEPDTQFDIRNHIHSRRLDAPGTTRDLRQLAETLFSSRLPLDRAPWMQYVVSGLEGGHTAIVTMLHHCLADGLSSVELFRIMHDSEDPTRARRAASRTSSANGAWGKLTQILRNDIAEQREALHDIQRGIARVAGGVMQTGPLQSIAEAAHLLRNYLGPTRHLPFNTHRLSGKKKFAWCDYALDDLRGVAHALGGTVNDAVLAIVSGAVHHYLQKKDVVLDSDEFKIMVPVSMRAPAEKVSLGNRIAVIPVAVPLAITDPIVRFRAIQQQTSNLKATHAADAVHVFIRLFQCVPPIVQRELGSVFQHSMLSTLLSQTTSFPAMNTICTNVSGPPLPLHVMGHECIAMHPMMPVVAEMGLGFGCVSYNGRLYLSAIADTFAVPDMQALKRHLDRAFAALLRSHYRSSQRNTPPSPKVTGSRSSP